jgi:SpoVK/Ycf46/Vps4 family AAA+-type ATPase
LKASSSETAYMDAIKAEFLTLWDGIGTSQNSRVMVLGATNKPQFIDPAILRRMPRAFPVPLPDAAGRQAILELLLKEENVEPDVVAFLSDLAKAAVGYSGSDLKEVCKAAAMVPVQEITAEFARKRVMGEKVVDDEAKLKEKKALRPIAVDDLLKALEKVKRTGAAAMSYGRQEATEDRQQEQVVDEKSLRSVMALIQGLSQLSEKQGVVDDTDIPIIS